MNKEQKHKFTFVDLFSGIGGFRIALEGLGGKCLGFSEINERAIKVYRKNFDLSNDVDLGSINNLNKFPFKVDLVVGGVPCQPWSAAGKRRGFDDPRGKLWMDTLRVITLNQPKAFVFENVKGLRDPRNKESFDLICSGLKNAGYWVYTQLLNSADFGVPQSRERVFIVGIRKGDTSALDFSFPYKLNNKPKLHQFIEGVAKPLASDYYNNFNDFFTFSDTRNGDTTIHSWDIIETTEREKDICMTLLKNRRKKIYGDADGSPIVFERMEDLVQNLESSEMDSLILKNILRLVPDKGYEFVNSKNSYGIDDIYRVYLPHATAFSTLTATVTRDYVSLDSVKGESPSEYKASFIKDILMKNRFRAITIDEASKLQGFPNNFMHDRIYPQAMKQLGNSVSVPVVDSLVKKVLSTKNFFEERSMPWEEEIYAEPRSEEEVLVYDKGKGRRFKMKIVEIEGITCSGKTTIIPYIKDYFEKKGKKVLVCQEPGTTKLGKCLREILADPDLIPGTGMLHRATKLFLYLANRADVFFKEVSEKDYDLVLFDRFYASTWVYQGHMGGTPNERKVLRMAQEMLYGHLRVGSIILSVTAEEAYRRCIERGRDDSELLSQEEFLYFNTSVGTWYAKYFVERDFLCIGKYMVKADREISVVAEEVITKINRMRKR